jgi:hypothetical protein
MYKCLVVFVLLLMSCYGNAQLLLDGNSSTVEDSILLKNIKKKTLTEVSKLLQNGIKTLQKFQVFFKKFDNETYEDRIFKKGEIKNIQPYKFENEQEITRKFSATVNASLLFNQRIATIQSVNIYPNRGDRFMSEFADPDFSVLQCWHNNRLYDMANIGLRVIDSVKA